MSSGCPLSAGVAPDPPVCPQDSLLASPIILDLAILTELCQRITFCTEADPEFQGFHSVLSILAFLCKAPLVPEGTPVVNALFRQRSCIENILRYGPVLVATKCHHPGGTQRLAGGPSVGVPGGPSAHRGVWKSRGCWRMRPGVLSGGGWVPVVSPVGSSMCWWVIGAPGGAQHGWVPISQSWGAQGE